MGHSLALDREDSDRGHDELPVTPCQVPPVAAVTGISHVSVISTQSTVMIPLLQTGKLGSQVFSNLPKATHPHSLGSQPDRGARDRVGGGTGFPGRHPQWGVQAADRLAGLP